MSNQGASGRSSSDQPIEEQKPNFRAHLVAVIVTFIVIALAITFGVLLFTGRTAEPGKLIFAGVEAETSTETNSGSGSGASTPPTDPNFTDDDPTDTLGPVTEAGQVFITEHLDELVLKSDLTISLRTTTTHLTPADNLVLYQVLIPTVDFYDATLSVTPAVAKTKTLVSIWDLTSEQRAVAIDEDYYLDTFTSGAFFEYFVLDGDPDDIAAVKSRLETAIAPLPTSDNILTFAQTGVTALSRRMNAKLAQVGTASYFAEYIGPFLSQFDLTHTSNESSFSSAATSSNICSNPGMIDAITSTGIDIIELTGNHNQDCGDQDAIATIDLYHSLGLKTVGGGKTAADSAIPLELSEKNTNITMLAYNYSTGGYTTDNTPGANFYTEVKAAADISAAKARGDFVIVDIQFFECSSYVFTTENTTCDYANSSAGDQIGFFRNLIDLGADIVVGTSAHQPQTFELYGDGAIYYGLGNLYFDQSLWPGTTRSLVLVHYFLDGHLLQTRLVPTVYDNNYQTKLMETPDAQAFLARLIRVRPSQN